MFKYKREMKEQVKKLMQAKYYFFRSAGLEHSLALAAAIDYVFSISEEIVEDAAG